MKTAYIVKGYRTAVGKAPKGLFRFKRTDELAAETIQHMMKEIPQLDVKRIDDVIVGNAMPEGSQGLNMARLISLMGLNSVDVPGVTVNRFCSSGVETIAMATAKIQAGMAECIIAGGAESMSAVPMTGYKPELNYNTVKAGHEDYYWGMGNTAEAVANQFKVSRQDQDEFAYHSHMKALKAQAENLKDGYKRRLYIIWLIYKGINKWLETNDYTDLMSYLMFYILKNQRGPQIDETVDKLLTKILDELCNAINPEIFKTYYHYPRESIVKVIKDLKPIFSNGTIPNKDKHNMLGNFADQMIKDGQNFIRNELHNQPRLNQIDIYGKEIRQNISVWERICFT